MNGTVATIALGLFAPLVATVWSTAFERVGHERREAVESAIRTNSFLATAYESAAANALANTRAVLTAIADVPAGGREESREQIERLLAERSPAEGGAILGLVVVDEAGRVVVESGELKSAEILAPGEVVTYRNLPRHELHVGEPRQVTANKWIVPVGMPIERPNGEFAGVAIAGLEASRFIGRHHSNHGQGGLVALVRLGRTTPALDARDARDGTKRFYGFHRLGSLPLMVAVGTTEASVMADAHERKREYYLLAMLVTIASALGAFAFARALAHRGVRLRSLWRAA